MPSTPTTLLRAYDAVLLLLAVAAVAAGFWAWHDGAPVIKPAEILVLVAAPAGAYALLRSAPGSVPIVAGLVLAGASQDEFGRSATLVPIWAIVVAAVHALAYAAGRPPRAMAADAAVTVLAGYVLMLAAGLTDLGVQPYDQALVGLTAYFLALWALALPRAVLRHGWAGQAAVNRRRAVFAAVGLAYVVTLLGLLMLADRTHAGPRLAVAGAAAWLAGGIGMWLWQRLRRAIAASEALTDAVMRTPWPAEEIDEIVVAVVGRHVRAARVSIGEHAPPDCLSAPLDRHRRIVLERAPGDFPFTRQEARVVAALASMARASYEVASREQQLAREAVTDNLTGLWDYPHWNGLLADASRERRPGERLGVVFLDLDHFKQVNSTHGHLDADVVLAVIGHRLRDADLPWTGEFCRFGGDEFAGWLHDVRDLQHLDELCARLSEIIAVPVRIAQHLISVTPSIGRVLSPDASDDADDLVARAEQDMRRRKLARPTASVRHSNDHADVVRSMLDAGAVRVAYQPVVRIPDRRVIGWEALVRGESEAHGPMPALLMVDSAERAGLLDEVTRAVATEALDTVRAAAQITGEQLALSLNLELDQLRPESALLEWLVKAADQEEVLLMLEISERGIGRWDHSHSRLADELFGHGIGFAVDDLGTGDAGPAVIGRRHWDWVKLDRAFLANTCPSRDVVLRHTADMLAELGLGAVLEGIETPDQLALAERLGLGLVQGNGLGRPVAAEQLLDGVHAAGLTAPCSWR